MTKISGYEDCHIVNENTAPLNGGTCSMGELRLADSNHDLTGVGEQNSCPRSMGDVGGSTNPTRPEGGLEPKIHGTSPTFTREELVEIMLQTAWSDEGAIFAHPDSEVRAFELFKLIQNRNFHSALDALIAIGEVKVK